MTHIFFWSEKGKTFGCFSNFYPSIVTFEGESYPTVEHAFQAAKSLDVDERKKIRDAKTPKEAKRLGRKVNLRHDWEEIKFTVMYFLVAQKFNQEPFRSLLESTENLPIYEDSPFDKVWGTGEKGGIGTGKNALGFILMNIRQMNRHIYEFIYFLKEAK